MRGAKTVSFRAGAGRYNLRALKGYAVPEREGSASRDMKQALSIKTTPGPERRLRNLTRRGNQERKKYKRGRSVA